METWWFAPVERVFDSKEIAMSSSTRFNDRTRRSAVVLLTLALMALLGATPSMAAGDDDAQSLTVPLSTPSKPASVDVGLVLGSIRVVPGNAGQVVIEAQRGSDDEDDEDCEDCGPVSGKAKDKSAKEGKTFEGGLRKITNASIDLSAEEDTNKVTVRSSGIPRSLRLRVQVPAGSSLRLSTVSGGAIDVEGITGELELHNTNGPIRARGVRGPVTANTVNGDVEVAFAPGAVLGGPMAFSTLNGDVDLTLPTGINVNLRLRTEQGDIYSDFDVELTTEPARIERDGTQKKYRLTIAKELVGKIGAGGPELFLKSFNGDIVLRQASAAK
jgi:hypothetical protein